MEKKRLPVSDNERCPECGYEIFAPERIDISAVEGNKYRVETVVQCSDCKQLYIIGSIVEER